MLSINSADLSLFITIMFTNKSKLTNIFTLEIYYGPENNIALGPNNSNLNYCKISKFSSKLKLNLDELK